MGILKPQYKFRRIFEIPVDFFRNNGICHLILDIDNTLSYHDSQEISEEVLAWLSKMKENGIDMALLSNNKPHRVFPFAEKLEIPFVPGAGKPLLKGYKEVLRRFNWEKEKTASIGDQLFTDIWGANRLRIMSVMVEPFHRESGKFLRFKRVLERIILKGEREYD